MKRVLLCLMFVAAIYVAFDLRDDAHNRITSTYDDRMIIEDFRM